MEPESTIKSNDRKALFLYIHHWYKRLPQMMEKWQES